MSSIDALSFAALAAHRLAQDQPSAGWIDHAWVSGFHIVAHQDPHHDLSDIPLSVSITLATTAATNTAQLTARIANLQVTLELTADETRHSPAVSAPLSPVYGGLQRTTELVSEILEHDEIEQTLISRHRADHNAARAGASGLDAGSWPCVTQIDYASLLGQVAQILSFSAGGHTRASAGNLWIRRARIRLDQPPLRLPATFTFTSHVVRSRVLELGGRRIQDVRLESRSDHGVSGQADFAYFLTPGEHAERPSDCSLETCS